jgi:dCTP diphosphatase
MPTLPTLIQQITCFRDARDWKQFHTPKDMALSLMIEAAELGELFQWKSTEQTEVSITNPENKNQFGRELADVLYWVLLLSHDLGIDLEAAFRAKMDENEKKYPVELSRGRSTKYSQLESQE